MDNNNFYTAPNNVPTPPMEPTQMNQNYSQQINPGSEPETNQEIEPIKEKGMTALIIATICVIILLSVSATALYIITSKLLDQDTQKATELATKIPAATNESLVFFADDLKKISADAMKDENGNDFKDNSYATFFDNHAVVCLSNGEKRISNLSGEFLSEKVSETGDCELKIERAQWMDYLNNYYTKKYELKVNKKDTFYQDGQYAVSTDKGVVYASVELKDNQIIITDDVDAILAGFTHPNDIAKLIKNYVDNQVAAGKMKEGDLVDVRVQQSGYLIIMMSLEEDEAGTFTENLVKYLEDKKITEMDGVVTAYEIDLVDGKAVSNVLYKYVISFKAGKSSINHVDY